MDLLRRSTSRLALAALTLALTGCEGVQTWVNPGGPVAGLINSLFWYMAGTAAFVAIVTVALGIYAITLGHRRPLGRHAGRLMIAFGGLIIPLFVVFILTVYSSSIQNRTQPVPMKATTIEVVAYRWWWDVRYLNSPPGMMARTANEIHIPTGVPVKFKLTSGDVIHSFWVPNLAGKRDLFPGRDNWLWLQADKAAEYRGRCMEFCGIGHANMTFRVVAEFPEEYQAWLKNQLRPAVVPATPELRYGQSVFLSKPCVNCHTIRGTIAVGMVGPDLTHIGSRRTIGGGAVPNVPGVLAGWIADPQRIKPGNHMAAVALSSEELTAVMIYLASLK